VFCEEAPTRFGDAVLRLTDPDGLLLELITSNVLQDVSLDFRNQVPAEFAIRGFHAPTLELQSVKLSEELIAGVFGFKQQAAEKNRGRFSLDSPSSSHQLDLLERPDGQFGNIAAGTVHHIAFRVATDEEQQRWRENLTDLGFSVTPIIDRQYFHSIYFREPGGILFEIATDPPGFTVDEPLERLGETLKLPAQYESHRAAIERRLPPISVLQKSAA
jgi:glyoxalase family protein